MKQLFSGSRKRRGQTCGARGRRYAIESLEPRQLLAAAPVINEFMASNGATLADQDGEYPDWIEIHNAGDTAVDLAGWSLTDDATRLNKWTFPSTPLAAGAYLTVFASNKNRAVSGNQLHTNFRLDGDGEYLALVSPDQLIATEFNAAFPRQVADVSYGIGEDVLVSNLVTSGASVKYKVPADGSLGTTWTGGTPGFSDATWTSATTALGYEATQSSVLPPAVNPYWYGPYGPGGTYNLYQLVTTTRSFLEAEADARSRTVAGVAGHLMTIGSSTEQNLARSIRLAAGNDVWIGLTDRETFAGAFEAGNTSALPAPPANTPPVAGQRGAGFVWVTGEPVNYQLWGGLQPDNGGGNEDFVAINIVGQWFDYKTAEDGAGGLTRRYIVEYELGLDAPPGGTGDNGDFSVTEVINNGVINNISDAVSSLDSGSGSIIRYSVGSINMRDPQTNGSDHFVADRAYAIDTPADDNYFALRATGILQITTAGDYTFGVTSDDGFRLKITGGTFTSVTGGGTTILGDTMEFAGGRGPADSLGVMNLQPGSYPIDFVTFEIGGGAMVELFAAPGARTAFDANYKLIGDTGNGGLPLSSYGHLIAGNVRTAMHDINSSIYARIPFTADEPAEFDHLVLRMRYDDGFIAYLNGTEVARRNAPAAATWNSAAVASRPNEQAVVAETIDISSHLGLLQDGDNVLAIQGLNRNRYDTDFLLLPELEGQTSLGVGLRYFANPTPGGPNDNSGTLGVVENVEFSREHGFYDAAFFVRLSSDTDGADIRYTIDGSEPTLANGLVYTEPVMISTTTAVRAAAFKPGHQRSPSITQTYVFLEDVIRQTGAGLPTPWAGVPSDYEMAPAIVNSALYRDSIINDLKSLPTMSIVANEDDLFGPGGIYVNPQGEGTAWERAASIELFHPDGSDGFQVNAGLRMFGGYSRTPSATPKHSFRLLFKRDYGPTKLNYPLFGDDATSEFDTVVLRANFNDSWAAGVGGAVNIVDEWSRQTQRAMSGNTAAGDGTFVHLYVNGLYWGLFNPVERHDASYQVSYFGGEETQWDTLHTFEVRDGDRTAWNTMINLANAGLATDTAYQQIQQYLDVDNLIDYVVMNIYGGNWDWPHNNWDAARYRDATGRFRFHSWDAEGNLSDVNADRSDVNAGDSPGILYWKLRDNAEFRLRFADRLQKHFFNGGALTPAQAAATYSALSTIIDRAVVPESARWGDSRREPPFDRNTDYVGRRDYMLNSYFPARTNVVLNQFRADGLYPATDAPLFAQFGGTIQPGFALNMSIPTNQQFNNTTLVSSFAAARTLVPTDGTLGATWTQPGFTVPAAWLTGTTGIGYERAGGDTNFAALIGTNVGAQMDNLRPSVYFRVPFNVANPTFDRLTLRMKYDDGFVAYLNGVEVARANAPAGAQWNSNATAGNSDAAAVVFQDFDITNFRSQLVAGGNVLAIHGMNSGITSSDLIMMPELIGGTLISVGAQPIWYTTDGSDPRLPGGGINPTAVQYAAPVTLSASTQVKARTFASNNWSALTTAPFNLDLSNLRVTELMYHPADPPLGSLNVADDFEFVELMNIGGSALDLSGVKFVGGIDFTFANGASLAAGQRIVLASNTAAFTSRYGGGIAVAGQYVGRLDNDGEKLTLAGKLGETIFSFTYNDSWYDVTDGQGYSLTLHTEATPLANLSLEASWRPSERYSGSPLADDSLPFPGSVVVNEVLTNTSAPAGDRIELRNTTGSPIDLGGWFLSDADLDQRKYRIPNGTIIPANGFLVFDEATSFGQAGNPGVNTPFSFSVIGGEIFLSSGDVAGELGGYRDSPRFDGADPEVSFGLYVNSTGNDRLVAQVSQSLGAANIGPQVGPVVLNEIMYHPAGDGTSAGVEYIELFNASATAVPLFDPANPANPWQFLNGVQFAFPAGAEIPANGYALVVDGDPTLYRAYYNVPASVPVYGPFVDGKLNNGGETIELFRPGVPQPGNIVPAILVDRLNYNDKAPWPFRADGLGSALSRISATAYGDDVLNWSDSTTGGTPGRANIGFDSSGPTAPTTITATVMGTAQINLSWTAASDPQTGVSQYQVFRNGISLGVTVGTSFSDTTVPAGNSFLYEVRAFNNDGIAGPKANRTVTLIGIDSAKSTVENRVLVKFSENVTSASATNLANYAIDRGILILAATLGADNRTVTLVTTSVVAETVYTVQVSNIVASSGNGLRPGTQSTFTLGESGFVVRMLDVNGGTNGTIDNTAEAVTIWSGAYPAGAYTFASDTTVTTGYLNFGSTSFSNPPLLPYPNGQVGSGTDPGREQFTVKATAVVTIPVGTWTVDFGSDDGGQVLIGGGLTFSAKYNDSGSAANEIRFETGRGHGHTGGTITVTGSPITTTIEVMMWEAGGGDSLDFSIAQGSLTGFDGSFQLLQDGLFGWSVKTQGTPVNQPPIVVDVGLASTSWTPNFSAAQGPAGYVVPDGTGQLTAVPWDGLNEIKIRFSETVTVAQNNLTINGVNTLSYATSGFAFDAASRIATWTLATPIVNDKIRLTLADAVRDLGNLALDGEWTTSVSRFSGNGTAGGALSYRFSVLAGDVNQLGTVDSSDFQSVRAKVFTSLGDATYSALHDLDGNGAINIRDLALARDRSGNSLPAGNPSPDAPPSPPAALVESTTTSQVPTATPRRITPLRATATDRALDDLDLRNPPPRPIRPVLRAVRRQPTDGK